MKSDVPVGRYAVCDLHTSARLDNLVNFLARLHGAQVKRLDGRASLEQLRSIVRRRSELLNVLAPDTGGGLPESDNRTVARVAFDEEDSLLVANENVVGTDCVQPPLHGGLDSDLVLVGADSCRGDGRRNSRDKGVRIGRDQVVGVLLELGMRSSHSPELCGAEPRKVGLVSSALVPS